MSQEVTIVGTGQMAVMCAMLLRDNGHDVTLFGRQKTIAAMRTSGESPHLPGVPIPTGCTLSDDGREAVAADLIIAAVPTQSLRAVWVENGFAACPVVSCAKGIEVETGLRPSEIVDDAVQAVAVLSGPNIAREVVSKRPAGAVVAAADAGHACRVQETFSTDYFRVYTNDDVVGVELAGATKNVIALAAGIIDGLQLGNNAKASLITRGLVEITRLGVALGARAETFAGMAGMGDLITTCFSPEGRNRRVGELIGKGKTLDEALASLGSVCEGVPTTRAVVELAAKHGVEMPIARAVHSVLFDGRNVREVLLELMTREPKAE